MKQTYFYYINKFLLICLSIILMQIGVNAQWVAVPTPHGGNIRNLISINGDIIANALSSGIYRSNIKDNEWVRISPANHPLRFTETMIEFNNSIYAATLTEGLFKSTDKGISWFNIHNGKSAQNQQFNVRNIKLYNNTIYLCTSLGLYISTNEGVDWSELALNSEMNKDVFDFGIQGNDFYLINSVGLFFSDNLGESWVQRIFPDSPDLEFYKIFNIEDNIYFCVNDNTGRIGYFYNTYEKRFGNDTLFSFLPDELFNYRLLGIGISQKSISISAVNPLNDKFHYKILYTNDIAEKPMILFDSVFSSSQYFTEAITIEDEFIYTGTINDGVLRLNILNNESILSSKNIYNLQITSLLFKANNFFAATTNNGIYKSSNSGLSWSQINSSPKTGTGTFATVFKIAQANDNLLAASSNGIYKSTDNGDNWNQFSWQNHVIIDLSVQNSTIFAVGYLIDGIFFVSNDLGESWIQRSLPNQSLPLGFLVDGANIYVSTTKGIYKTTDQGLSWNNVFPELPVSNNILSIKKNGNRILAASINGIYISENDGLSWIKEDNDLRDSPIRSIAVSGQYTFASTDNSAYISMDNGTSWQDVTDGLGNLPVLGFSFRQNEVYAILSRDAIHKTSLQALSQIRISAAFGDVLCTNMEFEINYNIGNEIDFQSDNIFIAELSDANGRFDNSPRVIGTHNSVQSGKINAKIPSDVPFGSGYRIRISSTSPSYISIDNLYNIIVLQRTTPEISGENKVCLGDTAYYTTNISPGFSYEWNVLNGEIIGAANQANIRIRWNSIGNGSIKLIQQSIVQCTDSTFQLVVINPKPIKPTITVLDSILISSATEDNQWYLNGEIIDGEINQSIKPTQEGSYSVRVINNYDCASDFSDVFNYQRFDNKLVLEIDNAEARDGEDVFINLRLNKNQHYYNLAVNSIKATLKFNSSILYPLSEDKGVIIDGERFIQIDIDTSFISQNIVKVLRFKAMLGNAERTKISLDNVLVNNLPESSVIVLDGTFNLHDICYEGGARLITSVPPPTITNLTPNPASTSIKFNVNVSELLPTSIYILNTLGNVEKQVFRGSIDIGSHDFSAQLNTLSSGDYYLVLESNGSKIMQKFIISR